MGAGLGAAPHLRHPQPERALAGQFPHGGFGPHQPRRADPDDRRSMGLALLLNGRVGLAHVLWSWVVARLLVAAVTALVAWRQGWIARPAFSALGGEMRFVAVIGMTNVIGLLNYKVDLFLVEHFLGRASTGVYSVGVMVAELLWLVSSSVSAAAYARIGTPDGADASRVTLRAVHASFLALALAPGVVAGGRSGAAAPARARVRRGTARAGLVAAWRAGLRCGLGAVRLLHESRRAAADPGGLRRLFAGGQRRAVRAADTAPGHAGFISKTHHLSPYC